VRVLFVSTYPPERDGIGTYCAILAEELIKQGHRVGVISARASPVPRAEVIGSLPQPPRRRPDSLLSTAQAFRPDVVHVQFAVAAFGLVTPALLRLIDCLRGVGFPVVITMHEVTRDNESLRAVGRVLYRNVARRADRIVVHTASAQRSLEREIGTDPSLSRIIAHPRADLPSSGVRPEDLLQRFGLEGEAIVLAFGFIDVDKGLGDLISAVGRLRTRGRLDGVKVVVAGEVRRRFGPFRIFELRDRLHLLSVRWKVSRLGLDGRVLFVGFVQPDEMRPWLDAAAVAVLPYRRSEQSGVGSLAMAAGTPLLTSSVGELPTMSTADPFPPADPEALAASLDRFLSESTTRPPRASALSDVGELVGETIELYRELILDRQACRG
jgi:glycosyltransferase involved in cell wall biosynthesis